MPAVSFPGDALKMFGHSQDIEAVQKQGSGGQARKPGATAALCRIRHDESHCGLHASSARSTKRQAHRCRETLPGRLPPSPTSCIIMVNV